MKINAFKTIISLVILFIINSIYAQEDGQTYYIQSAIAGKYMTVKNFDSSDGTPLVNWSYSGEANQQFTLEKDNDGYFYIKSGLEKYIHVQNRSSEIKALALIWEGKGNDNTKWKFIDAGEGYHYIKSKKGTFLDVQWASDKDGAPIWMWYSTGENPQRWKLQPAFDFANNNITVFEPGNFGEGCITTKEDHSKGNRRDIGTGVEAKTIAKFEIVNNSLRATITLEMSNFIRATWSKILFKGGSKEIESFALSSESPNSIFKNSESVVNTFSLPRGGSQVFDCYEGTVKEVSTGYGILKVIGDTSGEDISDDYNCKCDSKLVDIIFRKIAIKYKDESSVKCGDFGNDTMEPTYEFTIYNTDGFEYTFTDSDKINPNNFEVMLKPDTASKYRFKVTVSDRGSGLKKIRFNTNFNGFNISSSVLDGSEGWRIYNEDNEIDYMWEGDQSNPVCQITFQGLLGFSKNDYDRNEIFSLSAQDFSRNSFNRQVHVTIRNNLSKEKVNYFFDYK